MAYRRFILATTALTLSAGFAMADGNEAWLVQ